MKGRIIQFIESEKITAAEFADNIGVQRSSVSHVLNGRNNPGFSFIQKILETYPKINSRWLLLGEGEMYIDSKQETRQPTKQKSLFEEHPISSANNSTVSKQNESNSFNQYAVNHNKTETTKEEVKKIVKVLIFYNDQTFDDYIPAK